MLSKDLRICDLCKDRISKEICLICHKDLCVGCNYPVNIMETNLAIPFCKLHSDFFRQKKDAKFFLEFWDKDKLAELSEFIVNKLSIKQI